MGWLAAPVAAETDLFGEVLHGQQDRVRRRLAKTTDGGIHHRAGKLAKERVIPAILADQLYRLLAADPAGRALAAALILEEAQHVERRRLDRVLVRQDHDCVAADEASMRLQRVEIERHIIQRGRQDARGWAARLVGLEFVPIQHAARSLDDVENGRARRQHLDARLLHPARDRIGAHSLAAILLDRGQDLRPFMRDASDPPEGLDVVDEGRPIKNADLSDIGRAVARIAALALDRFYHRGFFAANIGAGAAAEIDIALLDDRSEEHTSE